MRDKPDRVRDFRGESTSGTLHTLVIETYHDHIRFTVCGPTGKRHATVKLDHPTLFQLANWLGETE